MPIKIYDREDNLLAQFIEWKYAETFVYFLRKQMDVYVDTSFGFFEYPKVEADE